MENKLQTDYERESRIRPIEREQNMWIVESDYSDMNLEE
jgi:hypothetical protein